MAVNINTLIGGNITVTIGGSTPTGHSDTRVTYTTASGHTDWSGEIVGELTQESIPNVYDIETLDIGTGVTSIGEFGFLDMVYDLKTIIFPNTLVSIGKGAFNKDDGITSITIPDSVTSIGVQAFYGCISLTSVTITANGGNALDVKQMVIDAIDDTSISDNITWNMPS